MTSIYEYPGFLAELTVNQCNGFQPRTMYIAGTDGTLEIADNKLIHHFERKPDSAQRYGSLSWPKAARAKYFEANGPMADGRPKRAMGAPEKPKEIAIERGPSHTDLFIMSLREGRPSVENALEGHLAAGAAHLANMAYKEGRRMT